MKSLGRTALVLGVSALVSLAGGCASGSGQTPSTPVASSVSSPVSSPPIADAVSCQYPTGAAAARPVEAPPTQAPGSGTATVTMHMDAGDVVLELDQAKTPCAVNSLVSLAKQGFFDDTTCHRLVPGFVLQCGDPTAKSTGGPGYSFADELSGQETYTYGVVAMANSGPDTNGSQFFIVLGEDVGLPAAYVVMGQVSAATMPVIQSIADQGVDPADPQGIKPLQGGHINSVVVG